MEEEVGDEVVAALSATDNRSNNRGSTRLTTSQATTPALSCTLSYLSQTLGCPLRLTCTTCRNTTLKRNSTLALSTNMPITLTRRPHILTIFPLPPQPTPQLISSHCLPS